MVLVNTPASAPLTNPENGLPPVTVDEINPLVPDANADAKVPVESIEFKLLVIFCAVVVSKALDPKYAPRVASNALVGSAPPATEYAN